MTNSYTLMAIYTNGAQWVGGMVNPAAPTAYFANTRSIVAMDGLLNSGVTVTAWTYLGNDTMNRTMSYGIQAYFSGWRLY